MSTPAAPAAIYGSHESAVNSSTKTLLVLQAALDHSRFTDIADACGLARSTVHRILRGLADSGHVAMDDDGHYHPGPKSFRLAASTLNRTDVVTIARPTITRLVTRVGATAHLTMRHGDDAVYLWRANSPTRPYHLNSRVGARRELYCTAVGKVLLAQESDEAVEAYAERTGLIAHTPKTITSSGRLLDEVRQVRLAGWAIDDEENERGVVCLAAPVASLDGVRHAISVSVLAIDVSARELSSQAREVKAAAAAISRRLGAADPSTRQGSSRSTQGKP
ncbi:MAG: IclR family transcriptional regulator [Propionibacteriaceae bacterium]|jgi:DNA-binding IclR family transcriptional regulator|nr:IclR family transcriptional regulator [Propionibacteriaceae bacterium]